MEKNNKQIILDDSEKELRLAALGNPFFILVQKEKEDVIKIYSKVTDGFDIGYIFDWIKEFAREDKDFKAVLSDFVIELSKEC